MMKPHVVAYGGLGKYAYGWVALQFPLSSSGAKVNALSHEGSLFGLETLCTRLVDDRHLIVLFCNSGIGQSTLLKMTMDITKILYGQRL